MNIVVMGRDGAVVAAEVAALRAAGHRAAGFVGEDIAVAEAMGVEMLGAVDEVRVAAPAQ